MTAEHERLKVAIGQDSDWRRWGPYLSLRQWGTVREDYSANGDAWRYFPFDHAHQRAYRWGEDGIGGLCDRHGYLNLAVALWNGKDDRIKERLFGLSNPEGNHGEDVKEYWWALDATPTHSWSRWMYRYPQAAYPYQWLRDENARRGRDADEFELADTGVLDEDRFFDVTVTHAKASPDDVCVVIEVTNHGPDPADLDVIPQLWFRNTWAWGRSGHTPSLAAEPLGPAGTDRAGLVPVRTEHPVLGRYTLLAEPADSTAGPGSDPPGAGRSGVVPDVMVCDNDTNEVELYRNPVNRSPYPKDAVNRAVVTGDRSLLNPAGTGTKCALRYHFAAVPSGGTVRVRLRLTAGDGAADPFGGGFQETLDQRSREADEFYSEVIPAATTPEDRHVARRAFAGLLWGKQIYRYNVKQWLDGDPGHIPPPPERRSANGRNSSWRHLDLADVMSMPDPWEFPWFATWDLAFHAVALAHIDPDFAKDQLLLLCREWAQHPNGQLPAYEWAFSDVNPPVHAWAAWQVYVIDGKRDLRFLTVVAAKLLLNHSWWLNRKDPNENDLFQGGFLGMDNIGVFDRSNDVPEGWRLEQSDATSWIAFAMLSMLRIAQELGHDLPGWDEVATTFLERFVAISGALKAFGSSAVSLWHEEDGFFYDVLTDQWGNSAPVRVRSLVGLMPLLAVAHSPHWVNTDLSDFPAARDWLLRHHPEEAAPVLTVTPGQPGGTLCLVSPGRYQRLLAWMLDEREFLSRHGIRSLSATYRDGHTVDVAGRAMSIRYTPGPSDSGMFGGNSNWRGPVWMPLNVLLIEACRTYAAGPGRDLELEFPTGSGQLRPLSQVTEALRGRLLDLFRPGPDGRRPSDPRDHPSGPLWDPHPTFSEYFHGDTGTGLGASHQCGWTALAAHLICQPEGTQLD